LRIRDRNSSLPAAVIVLFATIIGVPAGAAAAPGPLPMPNPDRPAETPVAGGALASGNLSRGRLCHGLSKRLLRGGGRSSGFFVLNAASGRAVCGHAARKRRPLASNMKAFTTATALGRFGPDARLPTRLLATGRLDGNGVLRGSLYLRGGGDPALGSPPFYERFLGGLGTDLFALTRQIRAAGVRRVTGRLYADDSYFDRLRGVADSGYRTSPYIGPLSGLSFNSGFSSSSARSFAADPARLAAAKLARSLRKHRIKVKARVAMGKAPKGAEPIGVVRSPKMSRLTNETDVDSNNFFAEMLLKGIGARYGGAGTTRSGAQVVESFARNHGSSVHAVDGSGLTRSNKASPAAVVRLLRSVRAEDFGGAFVRSLAVAGREGTVADRMRGSAAAGRCRTKTGTISGVSNLSGYCFNRSGKPMVFSILMASVGNLDLAHREQDMMAALIARY
jgi:D-alanyl-D-alanine carboxypeptidase/D-alanyl-D-alanine-endopeptidase (penicillin-binding protein 4)